MVIRKSTSIHVVLKGCFKYGELFRPVKCTAFKICQCSSLDELVLPRVTGILSPLVNLIVCELKNVSITVHDIIEIVYISLEVYTYSSSISIYCPF